MNTRVSVIDGLPDLRVFLEEGNQWFEIDLLKNGKGPEIVVPRTSDPWLFARLPASAANAFSCLSRSDVIAASVRLLAA